MEWRDEAIVLYTRPLGERSHLVSLLTRERGKENGAMRFSKKDTSLLEMGTHVNACWKARLQTQLGYLSLEMIHPTSALLLDDPIALRLLQCACVLTYMTIPEGHPYPNLYEKLQSFLRALCFQNTSPVIPENQRAFTPAIYPRSISKPHGGPQISASPPKQNLGSTSFRDDDAKSKFSFCQMSKKILKQVQYDKSLSSSPKLQAFIHFEIDLLQELGFGLDLERCAVTGSTQDLVAVSPKTGRAVSRGPAEPYRDKLLALPAFLTSANDVFPSFSDILKALDLTEYFLERYLLSSLSLKMPKIREELKRFIQRMDPQIKEMHYAS